MTWHNDLATGLQALSCDASPEQLRQLIRYLELLQKWNAVYNLTAIREPAQMVTHHVLDSLAVLPYLRGPRVADVGSGAGLPGIPVAIMRPNWDVDLVESNQKKCAFLQQAVIELNLPHTAVRAQRAESLHDQRYDDVVSRAFAELATFAARAGGLCKAGGQLLAMKGVYPEAELRELPAGFRVRGIQALQVPGLAAARHVVLIDPATA